MTERPSDLLYIGLDAGGSKTELLAAFEQPDATGTGDTAIRLVGPSAQVQHMGSEAAAAVLADLVEQALQQRPGAGVAAICAGVSGAGRPREQEAVTRSLRERLPALAPTRLLVVHDAEIALEASFEGESGIMVIAGTGSIALARTESGAVQRAGGWGYLLGDEGSGYALGLHALRAVAAAFDGGPATTLTDLLAGRFGLTTPDALIRRVYQDHWAIQEVAPVLLEAAGDGDDQARRIVAEQTRLLARQVGWLARRCDAIRQQIALVGGLSENTVYRDALDDALQHVLPAWTLCRPRHRPVVGAWRIARQLVRG